MCDNTVRKGTLPLQYVSDWFVEQGQVKLWHDDNNYCNDAKIIECYDGYN